MHPVSSLFFGSSGLKCLFAINDDGDVAVGYVVKQLGTHRYLITNDDVTKICQLAQSASDVVSDSHMPAGLCTFWIVPDGDSEHQHIRNLTANKCTTIEGNQYNWRDPNSASIVEPSLGSMFVLDFLPDGDAAEANGCNLDGSIVVGYSNWTDGVVEIAHAISWQNHTLHDLGLFNGNTTSAMKCSSDGSVVAGFGIDNMVNQRALIWEDGVLSLLPILEGGERSIAYSCNADGSIICGMSSNAESITMPVYWDADRAIHDLLPDETDGYVLDCSDGDEIIFVGNGNNNTDAVLWDADGTAHVLPSLFAAVRAVAYGCSADGALIVGQAIFNGDEAIAVYWDADREIQVLGVLPGGSYSFASGCSDDGTVISGASDDADGFWAVKWVDGVINKLSAIPGAPGTFFGQGLGISGDGSTVVGSGTDADDHDVAIIWT